MKYLGEYWRRVLSMNRKIGVLLTFNVVFEVLLTILTSIVPAIIVGILTNNNHVSSLFYPLAILTSGLMLVSYLNANLNACLFTEGIRVRIMSFTGKMYYKFLGMDYDLAQSDDLNKVYRRAMENFSDSNSSGGEAIIHHSKTLVVNGIVLIIFGFILSSFNLLAFVLVIVVALVRYFGLKKSRDFREGNKDAWALINARRRYLKEESIKVENGKDMRLYGVQALYEDKLDALTRERMDWAKREYAIEFKYRVLNSIALFLRDGFVYIYLIFALYDGMGLGEFTLFFSIMASFTLWIQAIIDALHQLGVGAQDMKDYSDYMNFDHDRMSATKKVINSSSYNLEFVDVSYRYPYQTEDTIKNLNFKMNWGEKIALVGINGAGKSTIVKMLMGLIKPTSGNVLLNGVDVSTLEKESYYELFSPVFQEDDVWALSVGQNIAMSRETYDEERICDLLEVVGLGDRFESLDLNLTRHLREDGIELSGGETQKLMLARALYKDAPILVLDEPTAALDAIAEADLYKQYLDFARDKSTIFISHRLSSTKFCDRIIFLEDGEIVEEGDHETLLAHGGLYATMYAVQSQYYKEERQ